LFTVALPAIAGAVALVLDVANLYCNWTYLQTGADAAVLAGASYLPGSSRDAIATANSYASQNKIAANEIRSVTVSPDNMTLTMRVARSVSFTFGRVVGLTSVTLSASSTAKAQSVGVAQGVIPLGIDYRTDRTYGQVITVKAGQVGAGNWEPLALGGNGGANYVSNIENGYPGTVSIGDQIETEPGNIVGPTATGITYRMDLGANGFSTGTFSDHALNDPRVLLVPMVDFSNINGKSQVPVKGFAELWVVSVNGNNNTITTYFIEQTSPNTVAIRGEDSYGAFTPVLAQ